MNNRDKLLQILNEDEFGIFEDKPKAGVVNDENTILIQAYQEINDFYEQYNREPVSGIDMVENGLYYRLKNIRQDIHKVNVLKQYDTYSLLENRMQKEINTIHDILDNDMLGILKDDDSDDIFTIRNIPKKTTMPHYVATRKRCEDFGSYQKYFVMCQEELKAGKRKLLPFKNEQEIKKGHFFVLKGILLYVDKVGERKLIKGKMNARLRCIFENGTESDMLLRSLSAELYKNGRRVTENMSTVYEELNSINQEDKETGFIYILKSKSEDAEIKHIDNLYKIGYSTKSVEERIKNAEKEPTYLMAPVECVSIFKCYNMNAQKFEQLLHNFFGSACLNIDIIDNNGQRHTPREWFIAPLHIIEQVIYLIINKKIIRYKYDPVNQEITEK